MKDYKFLTGVLLTISTIVVQRSKCAKKTDGDENKKPFVARFINIINPCRGKCNLQTLSLAQEEAAAAENRNSPPFPKPNKEKQEIPPTPKPNKEKQEIPPTPKPNKEKQEIPPTPKPIKKKRKTAKKDNNSSKSNAKPNKEKGKIAKGKENANAKGESSATTTSDNPSGNRESRSFLQQLKRLIEKDNLHNLGQWMRTFIKEIIQREENHYTKLVSYFQWQFRNDITTTKEEELMKKSNSMSYESYISSYKQFCNELLPKYLGQRYIDSTKWGSWIVDPKPIKTVKVCHIKFLNGKAINFYIIKIRNFDGYFLTIKHQNRYFVLVDYAEIGADSKLVVGKTNLESKLICKLTSTSENKYETTEKTIIEKPNIPFDYPQEIMTRFECIFGTA